MEVSEWLVWLQDTPMEWVLAVLFFGALIEYLCPPFPGDTVVVAGAALVGVLGWPVAPVFVAVTAGAVLGAALDTGAGRWLRRHDRLERLPHRLRTVLSAGAEGFEAHGRGWLLANRFMPGVRALFFVAAGLAGLPYRVVLGYALVSAVLWNGTLMVLGVVLGLRVDDLVWVVERYTLVVGAVVVVGVLVVLWRAARVWRDAGAEP